MAIEAVSETSNSTSSVTYCPPAEQHHKGSAHHGSVVHADKQVGIVQEWLGVGKDGSFGRETGRALKEKLEKFQKDHGISGDGAVNQATLEALAQSKDKGDQAAGKALETLRDDGILGRVYNPKGIDLAPEVCRIEGAPPQSLDTAGRGDGGANNITDGGGANNITDGGGANNITDGGGANNIREGGRGTGGGGDTTTLLGAQGQKIEVKPDFLGTEPSRIQLAPDFIESTPKAFPPSELLDAVISRLPKIEFTGVDAITPHTSYTSNVPPHPEKNGLG